MICVEWSARETAPVIEVVSRFVTRDRAVDLLQPDPHLAKERAATLQLYLQPTKLIPTDGIVLETSREITRCHRTELDKARAIYEWIVENILRDPKVASCASGTSR